MNEEEAEGKIYAYTPGLKVTRNILVNKTRQLPLFGEVLVKKGDYVKYDTIVASTFAPGEVELLNAAPILGVGKERLHLYMEKKVGDKIKKNEIIAKNIFLFGLIRRFIIAPYECTIESVSEFSGRVIIRQAPILFNLKAYLPGRVKEIIPRQGVVIETDAAFIQGIFGIGGEGYGEIKMAVDSQKDIITPDIISSADKGKILFGGSCVTLEAMKKAVDEGVMGIITGGIRSKDIADFLGYEIGVAITGEEDCNLVLIATESFGEMPMANHTFNLLKELEGQEASINGATQIRAGVLRPEIIVPNKNPVKVESYSDINLDAGMMPGTQIRVIRSPYFGKIAKVKSLPMGVQKLQTESKARVVEIEFDDGSQAINCFIKDEGTSLQISEEEYKVERKIIVPRANVELLIE